MNASSYQFGRLFRKWQFYDALLEVAGLVQGFYRRNCYLTIEDSSGDFVAQFLFVRDYFAIDLPNTLIDRDQAEIILRSRPGFFRLVDRPQYCKLHEPEHLVAYDPLERVYLYGDQEAAAEDAEFLFFDLWKSPPDERYHGVAFTRDGSVIWKDFW